MGIPLMPTAWLTPMETARWATAPTNSSPAVVRLAAVEQEDVLAVVVMEEVQDQLGHDD